MLRSRRWVVGAVTADALAGELQGAGIDLGPDGADRLEQVLDGVVRVRRVGRVAGSVWPRNSTARAGSRRLTATRRRLACCRSIRIWRCSDGGSWIRPSPWVTRVKCSKSTKAWIREDVLIGPAGWLDAYAGGNVEVRVAGTALHLAAAGEPNLPAEMVAAVRATFEQHARFEELRDAFDPDPVDLTQMSVGGPAVGVARRES